MGGKKKSNASKIWRFAGEPTYPSPLSPAQEQIIRSSFDEYREDFVNSYSRRARQDAAHAAAPFLSQRFSTYDPADVISALAKASAFPVTLTWGDEEEESLLVGAALWTLNYFDDFISPRFDELIWMQADADLDESLPFYGDVVHSRSSIMRLVTLFRHRKDQTAEEFRELLQLIRGEDAANLRASYRDVLMDYFERFLQVCTRIHPAFDGLPRADALAEALLASNVPVVSRNDHYSVPPLFESSTFCKGFPDLSFLLLTPLLLGAPEDEMRAALYYRRSADLLSGFTVREPFQLCIAHLILEHEDDVLANLSTLTSIVKVAAIRHLPWGQGISNELADFSSEGNPDYDLSHSFSVLPFTPDTFGYPDVDMVEGTRLSEAQLFYLATGYSLPLNMLSSPTLRKWFVAQGLSEVRASELAMAALALNCHELSLLDYGLGPYSQPELDNTVSDQQQAESVSGQTQEDFEAQLTRLVRQNKELRNALHDAEKQSRELQAALHAEDVRASQERKELAQLRDTLYCLRSGEVADDLEAEDPSIELPFSIERRVLIFGGHDTWVKAIRPLLPGARFFDRHSLPDHQAIRGADVLWLQTNAMTHSMFYRILDVARKCDIPVMYFAFASARKCAEQVVTAEKAATEEG